MSTPVRRKISKVKIFKSNTAKEDAMFLRRLARLWSGIGSFGENEERIMDIARKIEAGTYV